MLSWLIPMLIKLTKLLIEWYGILKQQACGCQNIPKISKSLDDFYGTAHFNREIEIY